MNHSPAMKLASVLMSALLAFCMTPAAAFAQGLEAATPATPALEVQASAKKAAVTVTRAASGKVTVAAGASYNLGAKTTAGKLSYKSTNAKVATVGKNGVVKAKRAGTANIKVVAKSGKLKAAKTVKVTVVRKGAYKKVKSMGLKLGRSTLTAGSTTRAKVTLKPGKASNKNVTYKSSNTKVATVSATGVVTAKKAGTAKITAVSCDNAKIKKTVKLTVSKKSSGGTDGKGSTIAASASSTSLKVGEYATVTASISSRTVDSGMVNLVSSDSLVLMVKEDGRVFGAKAGKATLTVSSADNPKLKTTLEFTVEDQVYSVDSDGDGISDYIETKYAGTDPKTPDALEDLPNMTVYAEDAVVLEQDAGLGEVLGASVDDAGTDRQSDDIVTIRLRSMPEGLALGDAFAVESCADYPHGISVKAESISSQADGSVVVSGHYPELAELVRFASIHYGPSSTSSLQTMSSSTENLLDTERSAEFFDGLLEVTDPVFDFDADKGEVIFGEQSIQFGEAVVGTVPIRGEIVNMRGSFGVTLAIKAESEILDHTKQAGRIFEPVPIGPWSGFGNGVFFQPIFHADIKGSLSFRVEGNLDASMTFGGNAKSPRNDSSFAVSPKLWAEDTVKFEAETGIMFDFSVRLLDQRLACTGLDVGVRGAIEATLHKQAGGPAVSCVDLSGGLYLDLYGELLADLDVVELRASMPLYGPSNDPLGLNLATALHWENGEFVGTECTFENPRKAFYDDRGYLDAVPFSSQGLEGCAFIKPDNTLWVCTKAGKGGVEVERVMGDVVEVAACGVSAEPGYQLAFICSNGSLYTYGYAKAGLYSLGDGTFNPSDAPRKILDDASHAELDDGTFAVIMKDGTLKMWGKNAVSVYDQWNVTSIVGAADALVQTTPRTVLSGVKQVSLDYDKAAAVTSDGNMWLWGDILVEAKPYLEKPQRCCSGVKYVDLGGSGYSFSCGRGTLIKEDGTMCRWQSDVSMPSSDSPDTHIANGDRIVVRSSEYQYDMSTFLPSDYMHPGFAQVQHTVEGYVGLKPDGSLWAWGGQNVDNELGLGKSYNEDVTDPVKIADGVKRYTFTGYQSAAALESGDACLWGEYWPYFGRGTTFRKANDLGWKNPWYHGPYDNGTYYHDFYVPTIVEKATDPDMDSW